MQFSCSVNESSVQFIEPVQSRSPSITTYLWCISVPKPITGRTSRPSASMYSGGAAGRGTLSGISRVRLALVVVEDAHAHAAVAQALQRAGDDLPLLVLDVEVVDGDGDVALRRGQERGQLGRDVGHRLPALAQEAKLERAAHLGAPPVAIAHTSSVVSTTCTSARSSLETMPSVASVPRIQSSSPPQYSEP